MKVVEIGAGTRHAASWGPPVSAEQAADLALRNGAALWRLLPERRTRQLCLRPGASHIVAVLAGEVRAMPSGFRLHRHGLHLLRGARRDGDRALQWSGVTAAVVIQFPPTWCAACPRAPHCRIGRFLNEEERDEAFPLDETARGQVRSLLQPQEDPGTEILSAEQSVLALLAWAYARARDGMAAGTPSSPAGHRNIGKARYAAEILCRRIEDPPTIIELARMVGLNECDLKRGFKAVHGVTIGAYSRAQRLENARELLDHTTLTVAEIASATGFSNPSRFASAFRRHCGVNPLTYRRHAVGPTPAVAKSS